MARMFIISGCNGAGKTTASYTMLPDLLGCDEYVDADEIAKSIAPDNPQQAALRASRLMMERVEELMGKGKDFGLETTLSTRSLVRTINLAKSRGYSVTLVYLWLRTPDMAVERVRKRYEAGGHSIPEETIRRRYNVGIDNLIRLYIPASDNWIIFDNSMPETKVIARGSPTTETEVLNAKLYAKLLDNFRASGESKEDNCYLRTQNEL